MQGYLKASALSPTTLDSLIELKRRLTEEIGVSDAGLRSLEKASTSMCGYTINTCPRPLVGMIWNRSHPVQLNCNDLLSFRAVFCSLHPYILPCVFCESYGSTD